MPSYKVHKAHRTDSDPFFFKVADRLDWDRNMIACVLCEFFCSFFLIYGGLSINAVQTIQTKSTHTDNFDYGISMSWGVWLLLTNYLGNALSGPHCNPAVSFLFFILDAITFKRFVLYTLAQFVGCYFGSLLVFLIYFDGISNFDGGHRQVYGPNATAAIFATYPRDYLSVTGGLLDQFLTTAILCIVVLGITDERNKVPRMAQPAIIGTAFQWSHNCGAALNPARDLSPRIMTLTVGYGWEVFSFNNYTWFWIPIVAPIFGAIVGGYVYKGMLGDYLPATQMIPEVEMDRIRRRTTRYRSDITPIINVSAYPDFVPRSSSTIAMPADRSSTTLSPNHLAVIIDGEEAMRKKAFSMS